MKKAIALILTLMLAILPCTITASAAGDIPFKDVKSTDWFYNAIKTVYDNKLFHGTSTNKFSPNQNMTRGMFVTVLSNISNTGKETFKTQHFADVDPKTWYFNAVEWAAKYSVVTGTGQFKFSPNDNITREQMATMLYRYGLATDNMGSSGANISTKYTDANEISDYAIKAMVWAIENKIIVGRSSTKLAPKATATRAEAAQMFVNAMKIFTKKEIVVPAVDLPVPDKAEIRLALMSLDEKIGQLFLARYPDKNEKAITEMYHPAGYTFYEKDFTGKTKEQVKKMTADVQAHASTPMFTAVDEEGGSVVRVSSNRNLSDYTFYSLRESYNIGGMDSITHETNTKDKTLLSLGLNLNLAPVCDISTNKTDYMYNRSLGQNAETTSKVIGHIVALMNNDGISCALKHFPGYGNNKDTHQGIAVDDRTLDELRKSDFLPFISGIENDAPSILVSHNIMQRIEKDIPASLSPKIHQILREELKFEGVIMTDDMSMKAIEQYCNGESPSVKAFQAGNDLLLTSDIKTDFTALKKAVENKTISMDQVNESVLRILRWKTDKNLI